MKNQRFQEPDNQQKLLIATGGSKKAVREVFDQLGENILFLRPEDITRGRYPLEIPPITAYPETIAQMVSDFSQKDLEVGCQALQGLLSGVVAEYDPNRFVWEYYACGVAVMPCCMGKYMRIVNRKEL